MIRIANHSSRARPRTAFSIDLYLMNFLEPHVFGHEMFNHTQDSQNFRRSQKNSYHKNPHFSAQNFSQKIAGISSRASPRTYTRIVETPSSSSYPSPNLSLCQTPQVTTQKISRISRLSRQKHQTPRRCKHQKDPQREWKAPHHRRWCPCTPGKCA